MSAIETESSVKRIPNLSGGDWVTGKSQRMENVYNPSTCLLYTSPSPRDQRGSRMPSSA